MSSTTSESAPPPGSMTAATATVTATATPVHAMSQPAAAPALPANDLDVIQDMIDCSADRLEGLRTQCATSATLTQKEIRSLETKLLRMFSELLLTKGRLNERLPASGLPHTCGSELKQWLRVVGLSQESLNVCLTRLSTLEQLLELSDDELKQLLSNNPNYREEEVRRLTKAMQNLRKCKKYLSGSDDNIAGAFSESTLVAAETKEQLIEQLFWDSWDRHHHHHHRGSVGNIGVTSSPRAHRMIAKQTVKQQQVANSRQSPSNDSYNSKSSATATVQGDDAASMQGSTLTLTLTPSPPNSPFTPTSICTSFSAVTSGGGGSLNGTPQRGKKAGTPPPMKKHYTILNASQPLTPTHGSQSQHGDHTNVPLSKSKSNESQFHDTSLSTAAVLSSPSSLVATKSNIGTRARLNTDPSPDSHSSTSSDIFVETNVNNNNSLQVPRSPCTPLVSLGMSHSIAHRFTKVFKMMSTCDLCQKPMFIGLKCKECKYRCHKDCEPNVPPSCCLPPEFVDEFKKTIKDQVGGYPPLQHTPPSLNSQSPNQATLNKGRIGGSAVRHQKHGSTVSAHADSSSPGSSCNSSSPSSPALFNLQHQHVIAHNSNLNSSFMTVSNVMSSSGGGSSSTSSNMLSTPSSFHKNASQFNFPDVVITSNCNQPGGTMETILSAQNTPVTTGSSVNDHHDNSASNKSSNDLLPAPTALDSQSTTSTSNCNSALPPPTAPQPPPSEQPTVNIVSPNMSSSGNVAFYPRKLSSAGVDKRAPFSELSDTHKSNDSDKTVSLSGSTSASTDSDRTPVRLDSTEDGDSGNWPRQNSLSLKEWDIPYGDLQMLEQIGQGRFGTVHRALWHGSVAVKLLKEDYLDDERMLEAFKLEVANFKKTRHENLVLFMGACMNPPYLAIVTSLCKGNTLYTHIHVRREKFVINKTTLIAQQITQGMGYLHARGIIHKDLRTKNIFLENGKVIITDFGLFSSTKLLYCDIGLGVPSGWLCYLAPELMRALLPRKPADEILPFSAASDVYSFGTVWYELLCGEFPFKSQPAESVIWQVGRGMKQTLANLQTSRDVKDILMLCWAFQADDRPDFPKLLTLFERLPKKRLARSPSHPVQLSRSAEAIF